MRIRRRNSAQREQLPYVEVLYAFVYLLALIPGTAFMVWYDLTRKAAEYGYTAADTVYAIILDIGYVSIADAGITFGVVEGGVAIMILARRWLERMEQQGKLEGREEVHRKWEGWNYRRLLAQEQGQEFDEPPPKLDDDDEEDDR